MIFVSGRQEQTIENVAPLANVGQVVNELYENALNEAKAQLHPLLRTTEIDRLAGRHEFARAFKLALEKRIARKIAAWYPDIQAVFKFDETRLESIADWDGSIHLLIKVPRLSNAIKMLEKALDKSLVKRLKRSGLPRFRTRESILDIQQVTPNELRHGIGYGAMFYAVYTVPLKVWP